MERRVKVLDWGGWIGIENETVTVAFDPETGRGLVSSDQYPNGHRLLPFGDTCSCPATERCWDGSCKSLGGPSIPMEGCGKYDFIQRRYCGNAIWYESHESRTAREKTAEQPSQQPGVSLNLASESDTATCQ